MLRLLLVVACVAGAVASAVAYRSETRLDEVKRLALVTVSKTGPEDRERARREALDLVSSAKILNPGSEADAQVAVFLRQDKRGAEELLEELTEREPENIFLWLLLTQKREREGRIAAARRSYARVLELDPRLRSGS
jgi:predicted Zn-dependent protease